MPQLESIAIILTLVVSVINLAFVMMIFLSRGRRR